jgi:hypothetical protein
MNRRKSKKSLHVSAPVGDWPHTGEALVATMQASPHRGVDIEAERFPMSVRDVEL